MEPRPAAEASVLQTEEWARSRGMRRVRAALQSGFLFPALSSFCRLTVNERERIRSVSGAAVFVANHVSALDAVVMAEALPRRYRNRSVVVAAADSIFKRKWEARLAQVTVDAFPIPRTGGARPHLDYLKDLLRPEVVGDHLSGGPADRDRRDRSVSQRRGDSRDGRGCADRARVRGRHVRGDAALPARASSGARDGHVWRSRAPRPHRRLRLLDRAGRACGAPPGGAQGGSGRPAEQRPLGGSYVLVLSARYIC